MKYKQILNILPKEVQVVFEREHLSFERLQEIRLRPGSSIIIIYDGREKFLPYTVTERCVQETLNYVSDYSLYAYENELKQGFITIEGGHRVGMAGQVLLENGRVKTIRYISSLNIRISHEILNCSDDIFPYIIHNNQICHTLIISPPRCGKTTLLRDMIRQISNGNNWVKGCAVGVVDERSELAGCYHGIPQNQVGMRTDVLDRCPKSEGMLMLIRSMSPSVITVDEIGTMEDMQAIHYAMNSGCKIIATIHGESMDEVKDKIDPCFERYVLLGNKSKVGEIIGVFNSKGDEICIES